MLLERQDINAAGAQFAAFRLAGSAPAEAPELVWAHGWAHSHLSLAPLAETMRGRVDSRLVDLPRVYNGLGISILSTPRGVMSDNEARAAKVGGEVLCRVF